MEKYYYAIDLDSGLWELCPTFFKSVGFSLRFLFGIFTFLSRALFASENRRPKRQQRAAKAGFQPSALLRSSNAQLRFVRLALFSISRSRQLCDKFYASYA